MVLFSRWIEYQKVANNPSVAKSDRDLRQKILDLLWDQSWCLALAVGARAQWTQDLTRDGDFYVDFLLAVQVLRVIIY